MTRAVVALGANLGDRMAALQRAVDALDGVVGVSAVYETDPVGGPNGQPSFLNAVILLDTALSPDELLARCQTIESALGRVRTERWGPRSIDLDLIDYEGVVSADPRLTLPHPRASDRAFVLVPWHDVDVTVVLPQDTDGVHRRDDLVLVAR